LIHRLDSAAGRVCVGDLVVGFRKLRAARPDVRVLVSLRGADRGWPRGCRVLHVDGQAGGACTAVNSRSQGCCQGQCSGRWTVTPRAWRAMRLARLIRCRRTVAGRAVA
jgi:hypothetical protein